MRASKFLVSTLKETPSDAEVISHQLLLRAGLVRKLASGLYTWLPMGLRVFRKVENIVREEMNKSGAQEVLMPVVQPADLWLESERWQQYGPELLRFEDRHNRAFCLGPTHEEVITDLVRNEINSYKQLPLNFYQIQTKFRDEIRPRFGLMRAREFTMKDAYSFHTSQESLQETYDVMYQTYNNIFGRIGLDFRPVLADTGSIGGNSSHEFHVLADSGEDDIAFSDSSDFAANVELAQALAPAADRPSPTEELQEVATGDRHSIEDVCSLLNIPANKTLKTLIVNGEQDEDGKSQFVALVIRGDHELNDLKAEKLAGVASPLCFADEKILTEQFGLHIGSIGPVALPFKLYVDHSAAICADFVCGANKKDTHLKGVNWQRDCELGECVDIRNVKDGDPSPDGNGTLSIKRGIEVGHIFQLGTKYSESLGAKVLNENGKDQTLIMGCYGIGVSRVVAAAIEQNNDDKGIIWPESIAPFTVALVPINMQKSEAVRELSEKLYLELLDAGVDVFLDDRNERPGFKFADMELIGIPHRITIGDRGLKEGKLEYKHRRHESSQDIDIEKAIPFILEQFK